MQLRTEVLWCVTPCRPVKLLRMSVTIFQRRSLSTVREEIYFKCPIAFLNINFNLLTDKFEDSFETHKHPIDLKDTVMRTHMTE